MSTLDSMVSPTQSSSVVDHRQRGSVPNVPVRLGVLGRLFGGRKEDEVSRTYRQLAIQVATDLPCNAGGRSLLLSPACRACDGYHAATWLSFHLANSLGHRSLIIDVMPRGVVGRDQDQFGQLIENGVQTLDDCVQSTSHSSVDLLTVFGSQPERSWCSSEQWRAILAGATSRYDYVLISTPQAQRETRVLILPSLVDSVLLLSMEGRTLIEQLEQARETLERCNAPRIGIVMTTRRSWWFR